MDRSYPRCSVIMTSYNQPALLPMAIRSVLDQTEQMWELIVADDNSAPQIDEILHSLLDNEPRATWWKTDVRDEDRPKLTRYSVLINQTFPMTKGPIIFYLTCDNEFRPDYLKTVCDFFDEHRGINAVYVKQKLILVDWKTGRVLADYGFRIAEGIVTRPCGYLDLNQVSHRRQRFRWGWPEDPKYWRLADGKFFEKAGPFHPIVTERELTLNKTTLVGMAQAVDISRRIKERRL